MNGTRVTAKRRLGKKLKKPCLDDCKGVFIEPGVYCDCLEKKLPRISRRGVKTFIIDPTILENIQVTPFSDLINTKEDREHTIFRLLKFGLKPHEVAFIVAKFYEDKTFQEIVEQQGWSSTGSAAYHFKKTLEKLRKGNFRLK